MRRLMILVALFALTLGVLLTTNWSVSTHDAPAGGHVSADYSYAPDGTYHDDGMYHDI